MNPNAQFERDLEQWLRTEAPASAPAGFHASVMDRARTLRQRPGWATSLPVRRLGRGRGMTLLAAAALLGGGALAAGSGLLRLPTVVPPVPSPSVVAIATASPDATSPSPSDPAAPSASPIPVAGPGGVWIPTGSMTTPRTGNEAVVLLDGRVLVVGGTGAESDPTTAELYDPASRTWSATGSMLKHKAGFPPTLMRDGRVLVGDSDDVSADVVKIGAEVYDPATGAWSSAGNRSTGEGGDGATVLRDGRVLITGQGGAQVYDPVAATWTVTANMITPRSGHTATLLRDGKVLVAGGRDGRDRALGSAELYDPDTGSWTAIARIRPNCPAQVGPVDGAASPSCSGVSGWATLLRDGTVLLMPRQLLLPRGPSDFDGETYDPTSGTWSTLAAPPEEGDPRALLPDDTVLMTNLGGHPLGRHDSDVPCTAAALYEPRTGSWTTASSMLRCDYGSSFTSLLDGTVLVAGGRDCDGGSACGRMYDAATLYVPAGVPLPLIP